MSTVEAMMNTAKTLKRIMTMSSPPTKWNKKTSLTTLMKMILMTKKKVLQSLVVSLRKLKKIEWEPLIERLQKLKMILITIT